MGLASKKALAVFSIFIFVIMHTACKQQSNEHSSELHSESAEAEKIDEISDENILTALYYNQRYPDDFYREPNRDEENYYTISHVKNSPIQNSQYNTEQIPVYEICAYDFTEALLLSENAILSMPQYMDLTDNYENKMYFEFTRVNFSAPSYIQLNRVFKCNFISREGIDINNPGERIGKLNISPINTEDFKLIIEYLWFISPHNNFGYAVLSSESSENSTHIYHKLIEAKLTISSSENSCDSITVNQRLYSVEKENGEIYLIESLLKDLSSRYNNGNIQICN